MALKQAIKKAVNFSQDKYVVKQVHISKIEDPQMMSGHHTVWVELSVTPRKRKKGKSEYQKGLNMPGD